PVQDAQVLAGLPGPLRLARTRARGEPVLHQLVQPRTPPQRDLLPHTGGGTLRSCRTGSRRASPGQARRLPPAPRALPEPAAQTAAAARGGLGPITPERQAPGWTPS